MKKKRSKSVKAKLSPFLIAVLGAVLVAVGLYIYSRLSVSAIEFDASALTDRAAVGEPLDIKVDIKNGSNSPLKNAELSISLPSGAVFMSGEAGKIKRVPLGEIGAGGSEEQIFRVVPIPGSQIEREFQLKLSYSIGSITATFEKTKTVKIETVEVPLSLDLKYPEEVLAGEEFEILAKYGYSGADAIHDLKLQFDHPSAFSKISSAPSSDSSGNVWRIDEVESGGEGKVSLKGKADLPDNSTLSMKAKILLRILGKDYPVLTKDINVNIIPSPLSFNISLGEKSDLAYKPGDTLNYVLQYKNNIEIPFQNLSVKAKITGQMYDFATLKADGASFDQLSKTLSWSQSALPALALVGPGAEGSIPFSIALKSSYPIKKLNDKNFLLKVEARIESPTVPEGKASAKTVNTAKLENKVMGLVSLEAKALFRDAESLILNTGSLPPKVDKATDFTIHWKLSNFATDVRDVEVRAKLEDGVVFTGVVKSNIAIAPAIDEEAGEIVWKVGKLFATAGITDTGPEAVFQIKATPAETLVGNYMPLISAATVKAVDEFTGLEIASGAEAITTLLSGDKTVKEGEGKVVR